MNHQSTNHIQSNIGGFRRASQANTADVLADIYQDDVNISIWQRNLRSELIEASVSVLNSKHAFRFASSVEPQNTFDTLYSALGKSTHAQIISSDVSEIVNMFCCLFDLERVGLRLTTLEQAMCPKFHVDRVPCRLVTTYQGVATEWLSHQDVNRQKLGTGSNGKSDEESGLYSETDQVQHLNSGEVALLKGESWLGNEGAGLVHRSPSLTSPNKRLLLTLDFN